MANPVANFLKRTFRGGAEDKERVGMGLRWTPLIALVAIVVYALANGPFASVAAVGFALAAAAMFLGALLGFLFAVPRGAAASESQPLSTNTNLEKVSDWLTTILVGVTLVQLREVGGAVEDLAGAIRPALGGKDSAEPFGIALIVFALVDGFLIGYLGTRLVLVLRLKRVEDELRILNQPKPQDLGPRPARR